ncbi:MAG: exodeoxyribonuclease VII large subunit [Bacillota bacterium]|nr:exodeoxyribonuclease VII large subunit [Bacillota bacterium]
MNEEQYLSVSQLNAYASAVINGDAILQNLFVTGEISNFRAHPSGNAYFTLKDEFTSVRCIMFRAQAGLSGIDFHEGTRVVASGRAAIYERDGQFQLYVYAMSALGMGELHASFEQLREKLEAEGLFDLQRKKPLPLLPKKIAVITSPVGAAIQDIINVSRRRFENIQLLLYPVPVQGPGAAHSIAKGIGYLNTRDDIDVMIVCRGGGSAEELWAFNEEETVRSIAESRIPIVSAVGHQTDFTLSDFAADKRAPTPSAAAEICVPVKDDLRRAVDEQAFLARRRAVSAVGKKSMRLGWVLHGLSLRRMGNTVQQKNVELDRALSALMERGRRRVLGAGTRVFILAERLKAQDPDNALGKGVVMVTDALSGERVKKAGILEAGQDIWLHFRDGDAKARVLSIASKKRGD